MSTRTSKGPKIKSSAEWAREGPAGATALIVAECMTKGRATPIRRVALDWLHGDRNKVAPLRTAAAKLLDTAALGAAGDENERHESDGSVSLAMSERCHVRWTIRSIPIGIITCWTGFEDAVNPPEQPKADAEPQPIQAPEPEPVPMPPPAPKAFTEPPRSKQSTDPKPTAAPIPIATAHLPMLAPMAALILNHKEAFDGNCAAIDGRFITDGRSMLLRSACDDKFLAKLKTATCGPYGPDNPVSEASTRKLFEETAKDAKYAAEIRGYVLGAVVGKEYKATQPFVCITGPGERITVVDGHRVLFIQSVTGANSVNVSVDPKSSRLTFFKDEEPVALLITMDNDTLQTLFRQILDAGQGRSHVSSIAHTQIRRAS